MTSPPRPRKSNLDLWAGLCVLIVVIAVGFTGFVTPGFFRSHDKIDAIAFPSTPASTPPPTSATAPANVPPSAVAPIPRRPVALPGSVDCVFPAAPDAPAAKAATAPPDGPASTTGTATVTFGTTAGDIGLTLVRELAPCTVVNFLSLAKQGFYTGTSCHRLATEDTLQMLQCGDPTSTGTGTPGYTFKDETFPELTYGRGLLAMANAGPDTNGSQFFMILGSAELPPSYTVFGTISDDGLRTLDKVAAGGIDPASAQANQDGTGKPVIPVTFTAVTTGP